jgi:hypothetical protein
MRRSEMVEKSVADKTAAEMLDAACKYENQGKNSMAAKALQVAINRDEREHKEGNPSLPRE